MSSRLLAEGLVVLLVISAISATSGTNDQTSKASCRGVKCGAGRKCVAESGVPLCVCRRKCKHRIRPVCTTDGRTFLNRCGVKRSSCIERTHLRIAHRGYCRVGDEKDADVDALMELTLKESVEKLPLVCFKVERDELRVMLMEWIKSLSPKTNDRPGRPYNVVVRDQFIQGDKFPRDNRLNSDELLRFWEKNNTFDIYKHRGIDTHVIRGLCVDALMTFADVDNDWLLDLREFAKLMQRNYNPPQKDCDLEENKYKDGAETIVGCNKCTCACGDWVCTSGVCEKDPDAKPGPVTYRTMPSRDQRQQLLSGFEASSVVGFENVERELARYYTEQKEKRRRRPVGMRQQSREQGQGRREQFQGRRPKQ